MMQVDDLKAFSSSTALKSPEMRENSFLSEEVLIFQQNNGQIEIVLRHMRSVGFAHRKRKEYEDLELF
jgi:hypothetical protein